MKQLLLLILSVSPLLQLSAQSTDPELAEKLKSVMSLFDKNQRALREEITELKSSNEALTQANLSLYEELLTAQERIKTLETENLLLRSRISEVAVRELEAASLQRTLGSSRALARRPNNTVQQPTTENLRRTTPQPASSSNRNLININTASVEEIAALPTLDEVMAEQIISNRPYKTIEDLIINQGFGPMKLRRITPFITAE